MNEINQVTQFFIGLGVLFFVYHYMYKQTRFDHFREDIFTMRDELFDYMWQHNVSYQLPAYELMRDFLNGLIRLDERIFIAVIFFARFSHPSRQTPSLFVAINEIPDPEVRKHFTKVKSRVFHRIITHLLLFRLLSFVFKSARYSLAKQQVKAMVDEFVALGRPDSAEARLLYQHRIGSRTADAP